MRPLLTVALNAAVDVEYMAPGWQPGGIFYAERAERVAGGKANNVARVAAGLGWPVIATGLAGGRAGAFILEQLQSAGITTAYLATPHESRTCLTVVDPARQSVTELREKGEPVAAELAAAFVTHFAALARTAQLVVLSGSLPPGLPSDYYARLAAQSAAPVIVDAAGPVLAAVPSARPLLLKPNRDELAAWAGAPLPDLAAVRRAAAALQAAGAQNVAVSLGAEGLLLLAGETAWHLRAPQVQVHSTVGSGDSLVAGLAVGICRGLSLPEAARLGVACGTANALVPGVARPRLSDIARLLPEVVATAL